MKLLVDAATASESSCEINLLPFVLLEFAKTFTLVFFDVTKGTDCSPTC